MLILGCVSIDINFGIDTELGTQPISFPSYRMASAKLKKLKKQLQDLLSKGFIRPNASSWGVSILFVEKDCSTCMCIKYQQLNKVAVKNKYLIPCIDDLLD